VVGVNSNVRRHEVKRLLFGNPNTSYWQLAVEGASRREQIVMISGELHADFFVAQTPMSISPSKLEEFAAALEKLDSTLEGSAHLASANEQSEVDWLLAVLPLGHIVSTGRFKINENELLFNFRTDQTQLKPLRDWVRSALFVYENRE
jgi:hypothetical protein